MPNRLVAESSPYLRQHADNPVEWWPWTAEAFELAKREDKPIFVSIGYAACHWCHVMAHESFEDDAVAAVMNRHFVNVKVDREERPDVDDIYMEATQAMTGQGGWPMTVVCTPDGRPFFAGTYFPKERRGGMIGFVELCERINEVWHTQRDDLVQQADQLTGALGRTALVVPREGLPTAEEVDGALHRIVRASDPEHGGLGGAPKFPQPMAMEALAIAASRGDTQALTALTLTLDAMAAGGIYDHLGGGFARYAVDGVWLVPHFEKMLYDNALLIRLYLHGWQLTGEPRFLQVLSETVTYVLRDLRQPGGGTSSAEDADSEGVEGKYYVWSKGEIEDCLGEDAALFCEYYDVTERGNWEHVNILNRKQGVEEFAAEKKLAEQEVRELLAKGVRKLMERRNSRVRPLLDDKILLGWNALMITAYCKVFGALGDDRFRGRAVLGMNFLWTRLRKDGSFYHSYKNGDAKYPAFLDDLAYLSQALIHLQEVTGNGDYLKQARELAGYVISHFSEEETGFFFFTNANQKDVILRKKEVYDGATPSGNAVMALNLFYLAIIFDEQSWKERAVRISTSLRKVIIGYPSSFGVWATFLQAVSFGVPEIALIGENLGTLHLEFLRTFIPFRVFQSASLSDKQFPLLAGKPFSPVPQFFLCKDYSCQYPVSELDRLVDQLRAF